MVCAACLPFQCQAWTVPGPQWSMGGGPRGDSSMHRLWRVSLFLGHYKTKLSLFLSKDKILAQYLTPFALAVKKVAIVDA